MKHFEVKIRYEKQVTDPISRDCGKLKTVNETYLVNAESCTEAEARIVKEVVPYVKSDYKITSIKDVRYAEIITNETDLESDTWYTAKVKMVVVDENKGCEHYTQQTIIINRETFSGAHSALVDYFYYCSFDYEIMSICKSNIHEYFK